MIAPVLRWATDAERKNRKCVTENGKEDGSTEPEEREKMRYEECWRSSVQGEGDDARDDRRQ